MDCKLPQSPLHSFLLYLFGRVDALPFVMMRRILASYEKIEGNLAIYSISNKLERHATDSQRIAINTLQQIYTMLHHEQPIDDEVIMEVPGAITILTTWFQACQLGDELAAKELNQLMVTVWSSLVMKKEIAEISEISEIADTDEIIETAPEEHKARKSKYKIVAKLTELKKRGYDLKGKVLKIQDGTKYKGQTMTFKCWSGTITRLLWHGREICLSSNREVAVLK